QGVGIFAAGLLAERIELPVAVGLWSVVGLIVMVFVAISWPSRDTFDEALAARAHAQPPAQSAPSTGPRAGALSQGA
ncbi:MAG: MFS transporter, partial [Catenulispora sp.]|nr:MFS transporter [Catenulispora sp.]